MECAFSLPWAHCGSEFRSPVSTVDVDSDSRILSRVWTPLEPKSQGVLHWHRSQHLLNEMISTFHIVNTVWRAPTSGFRLSFGIIYESHSQAISLT